MSTTLEPLPVPKRLINALRYRCNDALTTPTIAREALAIARDPKCRTENLVCIVQRDAKLATELLGLANSAAMGTGRKSVNLKQAFVRVGLNQVRSLIIASAATASMKRVPLEQEWVREILLKHGLATASAGVYLNRALDLDCRGEEFTCGLLHDMGRMLIASIDPEAFTRVDPLTFAETERQLDSERAEIGADHSAIGAWFASHLQLPEVLVEVIRFHHSPTVSHTHQKLIAVTAAADHMANHVQRFNEARGYKPHKNTAIRVLEQCVGRPLQKTFADSAQRILEETLVDVSSCCRTGDDS